MKIGISKRDYKCLKPHKIGDLRIDDDSFIFALLHFQKIVHHKYNIRVFQECISRSTYNGGFDWSYFPEFEYLISNQICGFHKKDTKWEDVVPYYEYLDIKQYLEDENRKEKRPYQGL